MSNNSANTANLGIDASKNDSNISGNKIISKTAGTSESSVQPPQPKSSNSTDLFANAPVITVPRNRLLGLSKNSNNSEK